MTELSHYLPAEVSPVNSIFQVRAKRGEVSLYVITTPLDKIEAVVLLSKGNTSTKHIRVEFDLENLDTSGFQTGATYDEIREWIQEKYRFHVSRLNIAQIKRKHGLDMRENYNLPKSKDSRQPNCPEEKEKAIEEALKHFKMI